MTGRESKVPRVASPAPGSGGDENLLLRDSAARSLLCGPPRKVGGSGLPAGGQEAAKGHQGTPTDSFLRV